MQPLTQDDIRILYLKAGSVSEPVQISLTQANLECPPPYDALSYCWGQPVEESRFVITCDGKQMVVTQNLHEALPFLRFEDRDRALWIDAICINQESEDEKSQQVGIMKQIYEKADKVIIWLGKMADEHRAAFKVLEMFKWSTDMNKGYQYNFDQNMIDGILPPPQSSA